MFTKWYNSQQATSHDWLHDLHRHPETGFEEIRTAAFVAERLTAFGYEVTTGIGGTGVVGTLYGAKASRNAPGRIVDFRAELDALPMQEATKLDFASTDPARFHGCGHDGHMVTALTAAAYLAEHRDFDGTFRFIFQPAEELLTGARAMIADGLFDRFPCDEIYALHNSPDLPAGQVGVPTTAALSSADNIDIATVTPVTMNSPTCVAAAVSAATRVVGADRVTENARSLMASEDFAELSARVPGAYFFIGQSGPAPHHPEFVFDTDIIPVGAAIFADLAKHRTSVSLNSHHLT